MPVIELLKFHGGTTFTRKWIIAKGMKDGSPPFVEGSVEVVFFPGDSPEELFVYGTMSGIDATVTDHLEVFFRDMADEAFYEFQDRYGLFHIGIILMAVVVESDHIPIVFINAGSSDDRPSQVTADIFCHFFGIAFVGFSVDIEAVLMVIIAGCLHLFKGRREPAFHFIQKGCTEGIPEIIIVEVLNCAPMTVITIAAF